MRDDIPAQVTAEYLKQTTEPIFIVEIGFSTPLRLSSRETVALDVGTFESANLDVGDNSLSLFDEEFIHSPVFLSEGVDGQAIKVLGSYGRKTFTVGADFYTIFDGYLGPTSLNSSNPSIRMNYRSTPVKFTPRIPFAPTTFNHLPNPGTELLTPTGRYSFD